MKNIILIFLSLVVFQNCTSQNNLDKTTLEKIIKNQEFTFVAERAQPMNTNDLINITGSIPGAVGTRVLDLSSGYDIIVKKNMIDANLPYFGRSFTGTRDMDKVGIKFTSEDFSISEIEGKRGNKTIILEPKDVNHINKIFIEISPNGKAYVSVNANDRQPISFTGYIMKNEIAKD